MQTEKLIEMLENATSNNNELQKRYDELEIQFNGINFELDEIFESEEEADSKLILSLANQAKYIEEKMLIIEKIIYVNDLIKETENKIKELK